MIILISIQLHCDINYNSIYYAALIQLIVWLHCATGTRAASNSCSILTFDSHTDERSIWLLVLEENKTHYILKVFAHLPLQPRSRKLLKHRKSMRWVNANLDVISNILAHDIFQHGLKFVEKTWRKVLQMSHVASYMTFNN